MPRFEIVPGNRRPRKPRARCPVCGKAVTAADAPVDGKHPACDDAQASLLDLLEGAE